MIGLNFESFWLRGTVEFRLAAGSTDYVKVSNWVVFTQMLLNKASVVVDEQTEGVRFDRLVEVLGVRALLATFARLMLSRELFGTWHVKVRLVMRLFVTFRGTLVISPSGLVR